MKPILYTQKKAFTLIEVLISIGLLGMIIVALFSTVHMMKSSNAQLLTYIEKEKVSQKVIHTLFLDILSSDGNISIGHDEYGRICMHQTSNSLYELAVAKVCWLVMKEENTLVRIEGNQYTLPIGLEDKVEIDRVMKHIELFDISHERDKVLVVLKQVAKKPVTFMLQGIIKPQAKKVKQIKPQEVKRKSVLMPPS